MYAWRKITAYLFAVFGLIHLQPKTATGAEAIDYKKLDHKVSLVNFRAGNHDESGQNTYFLSAKLFALPITPGEEKTDFKDRKKISLELEDFGQITLPSLSFAVTPKELKSLEVSGDQIRGLMSDAMRNFKVPEDQISIVTEITLLEDNKPFIFIGKHTVVAKYRYAVIPESLPHKALIEDKSIELKDKLGTHLTLELKYLVNSEKK